MDKTERLLDLIALFLDAREPVSWPELREAFPDEYAQGSDEACERKFERDKAELAELGIRLEYRPPSDDGKEGYVLGRDGYYLPSLKLTPEETAVLYAAGSAALAAAAFPGRSDLEHALRKLALVSGAEPAGGQGPLFADLNDGPAAQASHLEALWQALLARKRVTIRYQGVGRGGEETRRVVDPWGLCLRRGNWVLVGYCHLRKARRTFYVERLREVQVNREKPRTADYEVPADFSIAEIAAEQVWQHRFHEPVPVELELSEELAPLAVRLFPGCAVRESGRCVVEATYLDGLLRHVLALGDAARVVAPDRARERLAQMLAAVERAHGGGSSGVAA